MLNPTKGIESFAFTFAFLLPTFTRTQQRELKAYDDQTRFTADYVRTQQRELKALGFHLKSRCFLWTEPNKGNWKNAKIPAPRGVWEAKNPTKGIERPQYSQTLQSTSLWTQQRELKVHKENSPAPSKPRLNPTKGIESAPSFSTANKLNTLNPTKGIERLLHSRLDC